MKKSILMMLSAIVFTALLTLQTANAQDKNEPWPGITVKVLTDNDEVKVSEVTFTPGAVADWHSHSQHTIYAVTDITLKEEIKDKETTIVNVKAGQAIWSPAITHKATNVGKKAFTGIVTEIKKIPHKH
jgi:quercetin dioxygenase-like cupin family protein